MKHNLTAAPEWFHMGLTEVEEPIPVNSVKEFWEFVLSLCHGKSFERLAVDEEDRWWELRRVWCLADGQRVGYAEFGFCPYSGVPTGWEFHVIEEEENND